MIDSVLILLFTCHWMADYTPLSNSWMLNAKRFGKPLAPIFIHAGVHALLMSIVLLLANGLTVTWAYLVIFQWVTHFLIDTWKGKMNVWFPIIQSPTNKWHWVVFGLDQLLHSIVIIKMVSYLN